MDLKQLTYFERVAELGSFTKASQALGVAQPALSRQVRALEVELRQTLLLRNGRGAVLTEAGELLLEHTRGILYQVERARQALTGARDTLSGRVVLGMPPSVARSVAIPLLRAFKTHLPHAQLRITEGLSKAMQAQLLDGQIDVALLYNAAPEQTLDVDVQLLCTEALALVQAKHRPDAVLGDAATLDHMPIDLPALSQVPLLIPSRPNALRVQLEAALMAEGLAPTIALEVDGVNAIIDLVADGAGAAVLAMHAVSSSGKAHAFTTRPVHAGGSHGQNGRPMTVSLHLAASNSRATTPTQQAAMVVLREVVQAELAG
jgi:LysR family transcriptional regulator, nitrogen assimilation regulatory protein